MLRVNTESFVAVAVKSGTFFPSFTLAISSSFKKVDINVSDYEFYLFDKNFENIDGKSLVPLINGRDESRIAFSQSGNPLDSGKPPKEPNVYSIRTDEWKYIRNIHDSTEELYDLVNDPDENLCALPPTVSPAPNNPSIVNILL